MKNYIMSHLNFLVELLMIVFLLLLYGTGANVISADMNENVLAAVVLLLWVAWLVVKYFLLGYKVKNNVKE